MDADRALLLQLLQGSGGEPPEAAALTRALRHCPAALYPYLHWQLESAGSLARCGEAAQPLLEARRQAALLYLRRLAALRPLLAELEQQGVSATVLKGAALAHQVYPDPALRTMSDVDLWVREDELAAADRALHRAGFRYPERTHQGRQLPTDAEGMTERSYELPDSPVLVELHGRLKSFGVLTPDRVHLAWNRRRGVAGSGLVMWTLHPEDLLLHLVLHAADQHRFNLGLAPLLDITLVTGRLGDHLDWPAMRRDWDRLGVTPWVAVTLTVCRDLLGAQVPAGVLPEPTAILAEMHRLALEQVWNPDSLLPGALERITGAGPGGRLRWMVNRIGAYFEPEPGERWWSQPVRIARRMTHDIAVKAPRYLRGKRLNDYAARQRLARQRRRLGELATLARQEGR